MPREPGTTHPRHGEWWVCCHEQDAARCGGAANVAPSSRLVALYNSLEGRSHWFLSGSGSYEAHWLIPIRKVDLT